MEYPNCIWHFEESPKINSTKSQIYMRNIVWNIDFCKRLKQLSFWKRRACQKLKHLQFSTVPCLPKAYRNQANTSSLGIALWNICGISKSDLLRAFEALGAFRSSFGRAILGYDRGEPGVGLTIVCVSWVVGGELL